MFRIDFNLKQNADSIYGHTVIKTRMGSYTQRKNEKYLFYSRFARKGDNFDTKSIEIIALFVAFRGIFTLFSAFDGSFDR